MAFWVYILRCSDGSYYVGHTEDLERRVVQHQSGELAAYTAKRLPVELVYSNEFATRDEAFAAERQIKGWSRKKKEALMRADWKELRRLARGKNREDPSTSSG
jgi:predicted GIY-YIG superfamily endonuclease